MRDVSGEALDRTFEGTEVELTPYPLPPRRAVARLALLAAAPGLLAAMLLAARLVSGAEDPAVRLFIPVLLAAFPLVAGLLIAQGLEGARTAPSTARWELEAMAADTAGALPVFLGVCAAFAGMQAFLDPAWRAAYAGLAGGFALAGAAARTVRRRA